MMLAASLFAGAAGAALAQLQVGDVELFYRVYDAAAGKPDAAALQREYLDAGSAGLRDFIPYRILSADSLAQQIARTPAVYENARSCRPALATLAQRVPQLIARLKQLYPATSNPRATIVIGRDNSGGTVGDAGVILGLEVVCENRTHSEYPVADRLTYILAHELVHTQQRGYAGNTVLAISLNEGIADFIGELASGHPLNVQLHEWTKGHEADIAARFRADMDHTDASAWLYNGMGTPEHPGDLGYWVGYRIARAYYDRMPDKPAAIRRLLEETDAHAMLRDSGW
jgi:hypothetical protein